MSECGKHLFSLVGEGERMMLQLKQLSKVLWQFHHYAFIGAWTNDLNLGFAADVTSSLFCSRRWFVEVFTMDSYKVAKNIHNLKNQSTDLQKMKAIFNSTDLHSFQERPLPTSDIQMPVVHIYICLSAFCTFFILKAKWISLRPPRTGN